MDFDLINASAPADELDKIVADFIAPIIDKSPFMMKLTKMTIDRGLDADIQSLMVMEHLAVGNALQSEDAQGRRQRLPGEARADVGRPLIRPPRRLPRRE